jgi:hypothetical protein
MTSKSNFLFVEFPKLLESLDPLTERAWGTMNVHQMIEHMSYSVRMANGKDIMQLVTPVEKLPIVRDFMLSDKSFKPDTINPIMPTIPLPAKQENLSDSIAELEDELADFVNAFKEDPYNKIANPIFGELNFEQWTHLLFKHAIHHLKQFGITI